MFVNAHLDAAWAALVGLRTTAKMTRAIAPIALRADENSCGISG
jgi:hypothetical protein